MKPARARTSKSRRTAASNPGARREGRSTTSELLGIVVLFAAGWLGLVASTKSHELLVDAGVVALLTLFAVRLLRSERLTLNFRLRDVLQCWRIPWYVLSGCWEITALLLRDLLTGKRTGSFYRACSFRISRKDPVLLARSVLAVGYTTMAPNFIVIGIDADQKQMLFHQLERSSVPRMSQRLGAQMDLQS
jgi:multisubunit Na+/H+ antiporter MnhE subunit